MIREALSPLYYLVEAYGMGGLCGGKRLIVSYKALSQLNLYSEDYQIFFLTVCKFFPTFFHKP